MRGVDVSEKEQAQALKLLEEWVRRMQAIRASLAAEELDLLERSERFLTLPLPTPESHGQRRS